MARLPGIRPRRTVWQRLDLVARLAFPVVSAVLLVIASDLPVGLPGAALGPALVLPCVAFWSVFRPMVMPAPAVFALGLLLDLLSGAPLGVGSLGLLTVHAVALRWRRQIARRSFAVVWGIVLGLSLLYGAVVYLMTSLLRFAILSPEPLLPQIALTAAFYPALALGFIRAHRGIAQATAE